MDEQKITVSTPSRINPGDLCKVIGEQSIFLLPDDPVQNASVMNIYYLTEKLSEIKPDSIVVFLELFFYSGFYYFKVLYKDKIQYYQMSYDSSWMFVFKKIK